MSSGITVASEGVTAEISNGSDKLKVPKQILSGVNFLARPGEMTAIMGPSGCGKTTFLNVLSNRQSRSCKTTGRVLYDGRDDLLPYVSNFTAYVMQEDFFLQRLTVRETLIFAARLRLCHKTYSEQVEYVNEIMRRLGLESCADVLIGGAELKGISGGQRKRVSIAVALLDDPKVVYLDEPTSGLDAALAYDVVATLMVLAKKLNKTVIATIHQPRAEVFAMFDSLLLMRLGKVIYHGPTSGAVEFSASIGHPCPEDYNPSDFYLDLLTEKAEEREEEEWVAEERGKEAEEPAAPTLHVRRGSSAESKLESEDGRWTENGALITDPPVISKELSLVGRIQVTAEVADYFSEAFEATDGSKKIKEMIKELSNNKPSEADSIDLLRSPNRGNICKRFFISIYILWLRGLREGSRRPEFIYVNFIQCTVLGIVVSSLYFKIAKPDVTVHGDCDLVVGRNMIGAMMQAVANTAFTSFDAAVLQIGRRPLINREASGGLYPRTAALIGNWMSDGMFHYLPMLLFVGIYYWVLDLKHSLKAFCIYMLFLWSLKFGFWGSSTAIGALAKNTASGMGLIPMTNVLLFMVSGFQMSDSSLATGLRWLSNISPIRYAWQGAVRSQLDPDNIGYVERCYGFTSPGSWLTNWAYVMIFAAVGRTLALIFTHFLHKNQGVQA